MLSHWATLVEDLSCSSQEIYAEIAKALKDREIPETAISRVEYFESGPASAKREYLRVQRKELAFDICAAPFGKSFFFSWWMAIPPLPFPILWSVGLGLAITVVAGLPLIFLRDSCLGFFWLPMAIPMVTIAAFVLTKTGVFPESTMLRIPGFGWLYRMLFAPDSYYNSDTRLMYEKSVHSAVLEVVDTRVELAGLRILEKAERQPMGRGV